MRIIALTFPHFPLQVEVRDNPSIMAYPVVIGGFSHERKTVFDASEQAIIQGVSQGMPLQQAHSLCPEALFLPLAREKYEGVFNRMLDLIADYAPKLESTVLGELLIEVPFASWEVELTGAIQKTVTENGGLEMAMACASNKFTAQVASRICKAGESVSVPKGRERGVLSELPVAFLPGPSKLIHRLELLGLRQIGQLASMPREEVGLAFGMEGEQLWELSQGIDRSRVIPRQRAIKLAEQLDFDPPAETLDRLMAGAEITMKRLALQLNRRWQCCRRMTISFDSVEEGIVIDLKQPTASAKSMVRHLKHRLDITQFNCAVNRIEVTAEQLCAEQSFQLKLIDNHYRNNGALHTTIRQLQTKYGSSVIKRPIPSTSHTRLPEKLFSLVDFA